ncbi:hypothetical protein SAMN04515665_11426 [Blastococcus sp. DSM 46786]|uniref:hypothetical protein n=1 Tax=Blastococcus sp. DSM 46786 TaxID=1798227 RepID=UPI0008D54010|nr:hypothetical protein [Blastococcus sp. DSM 46786]SEL53294.1 hypothetical protein SAMN04515665_11426 [Blastococcus sp. DSM 46786]
MSGPFDDDDRDAWARAQAELDRLPPEPPEQRERCRTVQRRQWVLAIVLLVAAVAVLLFVVVVDGVVTGSGEVPRWQRATGLAVLVAGFGAPLLAMGIGGAGHDHARHRPVEWLTGAPRRALLRAARTGSPLEEQQLPLARLVVRTHLAAQGIRSAQVAALPLALTGSAVTHPEPVVFGLVVVILVASVAALTHLRRGARRFQRFLDEHPDLTSGSR